MKKTHKATTTAWREEVMNQLNLPFTTVGRIMIYKGDLFGHNSLVGMLVSEGIRLNITRY